jgi:hypothetical protein
MPETIRPDDDDFEVSGFASSTDPGPFWKPLIAWLRSWWAKTA